MAMTVAKEYATRDGYAGRKVGQHKEPALAFRNPILTYMIFVLSASTLTSYGILPSAQSDWKESLWEGRLPTTDHMGHEMPWGTFEAFENHVQGVYNRLNKHKVDRIARGMKRD